MNAAPQLADRVETRAATKEEAMRIITKETAIREEFCLLPQVASQEEVTEQDFGVLLAIADDPNIAQGRLKITPRRIPMRTRQTVTN